MYRIDQLVNVKDWYEWEILDTSILDFPIPTYDELLQIRGQ